MASKIITVKWSFGFSDDARDEFKKLDQVIQKRILTCILCALAPTASFVKLMDLNTLFWLCMLATAEMFILINCINVAPLNS